MARRFYAESGRLILSKPGYDAAPPLPDAFKIFDSNWMMAGLVITSGAVNKSEGVTLTIPFPYPLHYVPAAEVHVLDGANEWPASGYVTNAYLVIDAGFKGLIRYVVYGFSQ